MKQQKIIKQNDVVSPLALSCPDGGSPGQLRFQTSSGGDRMVFRWLTA
jgi:hypothetical protein